MSTQFYHRADHAVAQFTGDLSVEAAIDLVNAVDALVDVYFYRRVEILISSPGGLVQSIDHLALAVDRWRAEGVQICTRVTTSAYSAAAVLFSIGDERVVEPTARLLYHGARLQQNGLLNRSDTVTLFTTISRLDARLLSLLTVRALRDSDEPERIAAAEEPDEPVLVALVEALPDPDRAWSVGDDRVGELAQVVGHYVNRAVREGDHEALLVLYSALLDHGGVISAALAVTLRLADRIGSAEPAQARFDGLAASALLPVPEWFALFPPDGEVPRDVLTRHLLILGETGSGKTASAILPIVAAIARAPRERVGAALVVDPKRELCRILQAIAGPRVCHLDPGRLVLDLMCSPRWRLDDDLAAGRWFTAASQILLRVRSFLPASPLRVLGPHEVGNANNEFFDREGVALLLDVLAFLLLLLDARTPPPEEWLGDDPFAPPRLWVESFLERARGAVGERGPNVVALASWALAGPLVAVCPNPSESCLFGYIATAALAAWEPEPGEALDLLVRACTYWPCSAAIDRQHAGVVGVARGVCDELASPAIARAIYFGVEPGYVVGADASSTVDFERLVACDAGGSRDPAIVVYQPSRDGADAIIAAALKATFFEAVLDNPDRQRGGPDLPMVAYVADEAHRFVPTHGDQSFFEFSRSHAAFCVLASPSIASFEHALVQRGGTQTQNATSVSMLWVNAANKLFFRSSDVRTADRLDALCPRVPGLSSLTRVRPVSTLATGEVYALLADGRFERRQLEPFEFASCVLPRALEALEPAVAVVPEPERVLSPPVLEADATMSGPWPRRRWSLSRGFGFSRRRFGPRSGGPS